MQHFTRKKHRMIPEGQKEEQFPDELEESLPAMLCENTDLCQCVMRMREFGKLMHGNNMKQLFVELQLFLGLKFCNQSVGLHQAISFPRDVLLP